MYHADRNTKSSSSTSEQDVCALEILRINILSNKINGSV